MPIRRACTPARSLRAESAVALVIAIASGCTAPAAPPAADSRIAPEYTDGRLTRLVFDRDGNGKPDTWGYMDGARVVRVEIDENGDGIVDRWEYHRGAGAGETSATAPEARDGSGPAGQRARSGSAQLAAEVLGSAQPGASTQNVERIERATRHDGKITRTEFFEGGLLSRIEEDTDADGVVDKWETYANGELRLMALDTQHRGSADRRLVYGEDGSLLRIEADADGSGRFVPLRP